MSTPLPLIVVTDNGEILVFTSKAKAESYLEPIDVRDGEYVAYDPEGRLFSIGVQTQEQRLLGDVRTELPERVVVRAEEEIPAHSDDLRRKLLDYLVELGEQEVHLRKLPLAALVKRCTELCQVG
jgi:hypothetical protein